MVRKYALKLFKQILQIFVVAYNVDIDKGERFQEIAEVQEQLAAAEAGFNEVRGNLKKIDLILDNMDAKFEEDHGALDEPSLQLLKDASQEYQKFKQEKAALCEVFMRAECEFTQYTEYLSVLQANQEALDILNKLLYSKSVQDTIEVIKLFQLLSRYGIENSDVGIRKILLLIFSSDEQIASTVIDTYQAIYFDASFDAGYKA